MIGNKINIFSKLCCGVSSRSNKMFYFLMFTLIGSNIWPGAASGEDCDPAALNVCVKQTPPTPVGLPRNRGELDAHCQAYHTGMTCMDAWMKRCLPTDGQRLVQQQIGGARALMRLLCTNESALRRDFLKEPTCWARVSAKWSHCVDELQMAVRDIADRAQLLAYFNRNVELCCARDAFMACVIHAGRSCTVFASSLLRQMAWVLAQDVAACSVQPNAHCDATQHRLAGPFLTLLSTFLFYPQQPL